MEELEEQATEAEQNGDIHKKIDQKEVQKHLKLASLHPARAAAIGDDFQTCSWYREHKAHGIRASSGR